VPAYNVEPYIRECLGSVIAQAREGGIEIIVIDDCSTDGTVDVVREFQAAHPALIRFEQLPQNGGHYKARKRLLDMARGEHVWFVDSDDRVKEGAVASLKRIITRHSPDFVVCDFSILGVVSSRRRRKHSEDHLIGFRGTSRQLIPDRSALIQGMFAAQKMQLWTKIFRRSLVDASTRLPEGRHFEDIAFSPAVALKAANFYYEPTPWIDHRRTPTGIVATMTPAKYVDLSRALALAADAVQPHFATLSPSALYAFRYFCVRHFLGSVRGLLSYPPGGERSRRLQECFQYYKHAVSDDGLMLAVDFAKKGRLIAWLKLVGWKGRARWAIRRQPIQETGDLVVGERRKQSMSRPRSRC
jgi:glycosyltransferase involved in cell wall biosynthesis